jgi:hypothetical protein
MTFQEVRLILSLTPTALVGSAVPLMGAANGLSERFSEEQKASSRFNTLCGNQIECSP